ncbi:CoA-substrate-specific enzyme activase, putative [Anaerovirgula multivorans]|uniref:CoA-substrate-specific enzyme activase, putative n=1 Tax=Anaerovirgula multivorans TaxID=312168 RepID=A0A239C9T4_9FIRM|nr:acyl-CoA dehydratase activase [Anaerovirgula multivorans]SNS17006.1 CoA-substrate-specific enzyme activase, putative [Anaerovirgula multivorans]
MYSLGMDIGYASIKFVLINRSWEIVDSAYILHKGRIKEEIDQYIKTAIGKYGEKNITNAAATGQGSKFLSTDQRLTWINEVTSLVEGSRHLYPNINSIVEIGGQSAKYITNIGESHKSNIKISINSNCSAGTGSFIEEQVSRLGIKLEDYSKYTERATFVPRIAGRCSVFAKTDIIHHQQEGTDAKDILLGLAHALVKNYRANVVKKHPIMKPVLFTGGVAYNQAIFEVLKDILKLKENEMIIPEDCGNMGALGAAMIASKENLSVDLSKLQNIIQKSDTKINLIEDRVILPSLGKYGKNDSLDKHNCKVVEANSKVSGYIGLDVGSTSINVVLMDQEDNIIAFKYLRTLGDPIKAVKKGLLGIREDVGKDIRVLGVGATGSGRYMTGKFVGVDVIIDEITAQAKAAQSIDKEVDTIIEIGGQDSKFIKLENGVVTDFEMNKICAAGTGSFIEEQAKKLKIPISEFGDLALSSQNPIDLGDRCTVFIETNIAASLSKEAKLEDIASGLSYSIVKNYLNKVVGKKQIGEKVFFQGGVAHNQGVINAFRAILGDKLVVPKFFSITGAYGVAILAKEEMKESASLFKGFDLEGSVDFKEAGKKDIKGENKKTKVYEEIEKHYLKGYEGLVDPKKKTVGIPRVLFLHKLFPMFNTFFRELGFNTLLSDVSSEKTVALSQEFTMEETCYPIKLINGHIAELIEKEVDYVFLPSLYTMAHPVSITRQNYGCVYMQCVPKLINKTMELEKRGIELLAPKLSFEFGKKYMMKTLMELGGKLKRNPVQTALAITKSMKSLKGFEKKVEELGQETIKKLKKDEKAFVIVTRAYGVADPILNMGIPEKLEKLGHKVLTLSNLPAHDHDTSKEHPNMYWPFGQHILSGAQIIRQHPNLYPIYITNHGCGPDTVLSHYFKEEMQGKPYLNIEVDEHASSVGVLTRIEAFINSLKAERIKESETLELKYYSDKVKHKTTNIKPRLDEIDKNTVVYLPYIYPYAHFAAAYLESKGFKAKVLPMTTQKTLDIGRKHTMSKEYLSLTALVGDVLNKAQELEGSDEHFGFLIPTSEGSEAGGQYYRLLRDKLDREGLNKVEIIAPFIEDLIKDGTVAEDLFLMLLGGDIINLAPKKKRDDYFEEVQRLIIKKQLSIDSLKNMAKEINKGMEKNKSSKRIFLLGEVPILFNDFMNNNIFKSIEDEGIELMYTPLSEYMWFIWRDYLSQKNNKKEILAHKALMKFLGYIETISEIFTRENPFEKHLEELLESADKYLGFYSGGNGRYRKAKILGELAYVKGIITVSSMYENTNTILNVLSEEENSTSMLPILNMTFDGNENEIDKTKIDSFIYYGLQGSKVIESDKKRGA